MPTMTPKTAPRRPVLAGTPKPRTAIAPAPLPRVDAPLRTVIAPQKFPLLKQLKIAVPVVLIIIVFIYVFITWSPTSVAVSVSDVPRQVAAPGLVEPDSGVLKLAFEISGKLRTVCVNEGQAVTAGQILAELENNEQQARVAAASANVQVAELNLQNLEHNLECELARLNQSVESSRADLALLKAGPRIEEIARAKADVTAAEADARRAQDEAQKYNNPEGLKKGAWSIQTRDSAVCAADAAAARLKSAHEMLNQLQNGSRKEELEKAAAVLGAAQADLKRCQATRDIRMQTARAQILETRAQLKIAEAELNKTILRSPIAGTVLWKYHYSGETVGVLPPDIVVAIADCGQLRVRADVDEADFSLLKVGQAVRISADAYPGQHFKGRIVSIGNSAGQKRFTTGDAAERMDVKVVETLIGLETNCPLKTGIRVTAYFDEH
jgi:HlyD family secretion protein